MKKLTPLIKHKVEWSFLLVLGESRLVSSMYVWLIVVPVASKLLFNFGETAEIILFSHKFLVNLTLPFSWKVFYLAAICFTIATLIFRFRCPKIIREHRSFDSFSAQQRPEWHLMFYTEDIGLNFSEYKNKLRKNQELYPLIEPEKASKPITSGIFWELHRYSNQIRAVSYYLSLLFYTAGTLCILWVFVQNLFWVLKSWQM